MGDKALRALTRDGERMDHLGPRLRHLTTPAQHDEPRYTLEWVLPLEPGLFTNVLLFDLERFSPEVVTRGAGADEAGRCSPCGPRASNSSWRSRISV